MKFPALLHVAIAKPANDDEYLFALGDGVEGASEEMPVAIYKLVKVGRVSITKRFVEK